MTKEEFVHLAEGMEEQIHRIACAYLSREADRLDAAQETLLKAWKSRDSLKNPQYFRTWIIRILIRECVNIQRHHKKITPVDNLPERPAEMNQDALLLRQAIERLPAHQRIVTVLFYMEGYSVDEIAGMLRLPKGTVCSRLKRARNQLKQYLEEEGEP